MDRVTEKLKRAAGVVARSNASLETEADRLIAREQQFEERKAAAFAPHHKLLDSRNREMDQLEDALKIVGNADPLQASGDSSSEDTEFAPTHPAIETKTAPVIAAAPSAPAVVVDHPATFPSNEMQGVREG